MEIWGALGGGEGRTIVERLEALNQLDLTQDPIRVLIVFVEERPKHNGKQSSLISRYLRIHSLSKATQVQQDAPIIVWASKRPANSRLWALRVHKRTHTK